MGQIRKLECYEVTVELPDKMSIPSVNKHKEVGRGGKHMYKPSRVRNYQEEVIRQLSSSCFSEINFKEKPVLRVKFVFYFKNRYWRRDVTNMIKSTEDALKEVLGVDDGRTIHVTADKVKHYEKIEKILISVEVTSEDEIEVEDESNARRIS